MVLALAVCYFTNTLTLGQTLSGFSSGAVWMIGAAIILGVGFSELPRPYGRGFEEP